MTGRENSSKKSFIHDHGKPSSITDRVITYCIVLMLLFFAMSGYLPTSGTRTSSLQSMTSDSDTIIGQLFQLLMWSMAVILMSRNYKDVLNTCREMKIMTALSLLAPISSLWSQNSSNSLRRGVLLLLGTLFAFYLAKRFSANELGQILIITGVIAGILSVITSLLFPQFGLDTFNNNAWQGIFRSKNGCAQVMLFLLTPAGSLIFTSRLMRMMRYLLFLLAIILILLSNAKTAWLLAPGYFVMMSVASRLRVLKRRDAMLLALGIVACTSLLAASSVLVLPTLMEAMGKSSSGSGRIPLWAAAFVSFLKHPMLGYGYASFWTGLQGESLNIFMTTRFEIYQAQNGILEVGLELGIVGVVLVSLTFFKAIKDALICFQRGHTEVVNWYVGLIVLTICYNIDETFLASAHSLPWLLYIVACTGLAVEARKARIPTPTRRSLENSSSFVFMPLRDSSHSL
jgi:exopolysaccharide production protein ExoQ